MIKDLYHILYTTALNGSCMFRKYAALLIKDNQIISVGVATTLDGRKCEDCPRFELIKKYGNIAEFFESCRVVHAEVSAILNCKNLSEAQGSDLYLLGISEDTQSVYQSAYPCNNCMRIIKYVGIRRIYVFQSEDTLDFSEASNYDY